MPSRFRIRRTKASPKAAPIITAWRMADPHKAMPTEVVAEPIPPTVNFKRTSPNAKAPFYATDGSAGFDLSTAEHVILQPGPPSLVSTGLVIATPADHMLYITFRSSTPRKYGVVVHTGIVDSDYQGDDDVLRLQVWNVSDKPVELKMGTRLAQGVFVPVARANFNEVESMGQSRGGFGSTGD